MVNDPGNADLSPREIDLLNRASTEHETEDEWEVGRFTHSFEEFVAHEPQGDAKVLTIPFVDLLAAVGRKDDAAAIERDAQAKELFDSVFGA